MKITEKSPTATLTTTEATEPKMPEMFDKSTTSEIFSISSWTPSKSLSTQGKDWMIQSLACMMMEFPSMDSCSFMNEASPKMLETTGITCIINKNSTAKMVTRVMIAKTASGADFPLILILRSSLRKGCPMSETTNAMRM